jgi:hypothetical protein
MPKESKAKPVDTMKSTLTFDNLLTQEHEAPEWVADMHRYYARHGHFRGADVRRVLGNPMASTGGCAVAEFAGNGQTQKQ